MFEEKFSLTGNYSSLISSKYSNRNRSLFPSKYSTRRKKETIWRTKSNERKNHYLSSMRRSNAMIDRIKDADLKANECTVFFADDSKSHKIRRRALMDSKGKSKNSRNDKMCNRTNQSKKAVKCGRFENIEEKGRNKSTCGNRGSTREKIEKVKRKFDDVLHQKDDMCQESHCKKTRKSKEECTGKSRKTTNKEVCEKNSRSFKDPNSTDTRQKSPCDGNNKPISREKSKYSVKKDSKTSPCSKSSSDCEYNQKGSPQRKYFPEEGKHNRKSVLDCEDNADDSQSGTEDSDTCSDSVVEQDEQMKGPCNTDETVQELKTIKQRQKERKIRRKNYQKDCKKEAKAKIRQFKQDEKTRKQNAKKEIAMLKRKDKQEEKELKLCRKKKMQCLKNKEKMKKMQKQIELRKLVDSLRTACKSASFGQSSEPVRC